MQSPPSSQNHLKIRCQCLSTMCSLMIMAFNGERTAEGSRILHPRNLFCSMLDHPLSGQIPLVLLDALSFVLVHTGGCLVLSSFVFLVSLRKRNRTTRTLTSHEYGQYRATDVIKCLFQEPSTDWPFICSSAGQSNPTSSFSFASTLTKGSSNLYVLP